MDKGNELVEKIKKTLKNKKTYKFIGISILILFLSLYSLAFIMKDHANSEFSRYLCKEFVNGPRNVVAMTLNKISGKNIISYKTKILTSTEKGILLDSEREIGKALGREELQRELEMIEQEKNEKEKEISIKVEKPLGIKLLEDLEKELNEQKEIEKMLLGELNSGEYTFDDPYIILNPYGKSLLTALLLFITDEPLLIEVEVEGKDKETELKFKFEKNGYKKIHVVPVYGLYPKKDNRIIIKGNNLSGNVIKKEFFIKTENLSSDLNDVQIIVHNLKKDKVAKGLNFSYLGINNEPQKKAFDVNGDIRWYFLKSFSELIAANFNQIDSIYIAQGNYFFGDTFVLEKNLLGKIKKIYYTPHGLHHDIFVGETEIVLTGNSEKGTVEDVISGIDIETGEENFFIDYKTKLQRTMGENNKDWLHTNAVIEYKENLIFSNRHQSSIIKSDKFGNIEWILGRPEGYLEFLRQKLLKPKGNKFLFPSYQHAPMILPDYDNNPNTVDILLFDNGNQHKEEKLFSRLVHYRINEKDMTVEQIWEYGKERPELYSEWQGDANLLKNGNILGVFPRRIGKHEVKDDTVYLEIDRDKNIIWECLITSKREENKYSDYRVERLPIYTEAANDIKLGIPAKNLIPKEVYEKYGLKKEEPQEIIEEKEETKNEN